MNETTADSKAAVAEAEPPERPPRETSPERIAPAIEAVLFSSAKPVRERDLAELLDATPAAVTGALEMLRGRTDEDGRGIRVEKVAGGWRFVTRPEFDALLRRFHEVTERSRLSLAALETLAIIAYRQPITLPEVQEIRGVNCASVLKTLFEKKLVTTAGKKAVVGTPFLYRTTPDFLMRFGLNDLDELPRPEDLDADLAATLEAREIAAPTAGPPGIRVEAGETSAAEERRVAGRAEGPRADRRKESPDADAPPESDADAEE